ncbi:MAG TPA: NRAMP family divalent metal transporter [Solirubrobacteraceae bacterium]|nr:NRAMP family divalent metal transporter [Solirubrobacteraceae bacterium]
MASGVPTGAPRQSPAPPPARPASAAPPAEEIKGAFGTIHVSEDGHRGLRSRVLALLAIIGPGLIVLIGDNDAGGVSTYAQAGQQYGPSLLWVLLLLIPVLIVNQEMVVRLGAVTGVGHAKLIIERFGRGWGWFESGYLLLQNFLIIVTEFIGVSLALSYFGVSPYISVPVAAAALVAVSASGSFRLWERSMFLFMFGNLLMIPLFFLAHPRGGSIVHHLFVPGIRGGATSSAVLLLISIVGTTVAPWQLFFQQSNIVDKRITPRWINYERLDTVIGAVIVVVGAGALICATAFGLGGTHYFGDFNNAGQTATDLKHAISPLAGGFFAVVLLNASLIGAGVVTLATSYVVGDVFGTRGSLHRSFLEAKGFYSVFIVVILAAAGIVLIPGAPLGVIIEAVQALCGILLPMTTLFLLMLCNDREVLGPWTNPPWLKALAAVIVGVLILLSLTLTVTTIFPGIDVGRMFVIGAIVLGAVLAGMALAAWRARPTSRQVAAVISAAESEVPREQWTMPPSALLSRPQFSGPVRIALLVLGAYMAVALVMLIVKSVELATS